MNFQELLQKLNEIENPIQEEPNEGNLFTGNLAAARAAGKDQADLDGDGDMEKVREDDVEECGMGPMSPMDNKQQDNVSMSVNMNGSGSGGIKDLLDILRNLENGGDAGGDLEKMIGKMDHPEKEPLVGSGDVGMAEFANSPEDTGTADPVYASVDSMTPSGDDLHRAKGAYRATQLGDNPMAIQERLDRLYQEIKQR